MAASLSVAHGSRGGRRSRGQGEIGGERGGWNAAPPGFRRRQRAAPLRSLQWQMLLHFADAAARDSLILHPLDKYTIVP
jgi:hypothetical protein